MRLVNVTGNIPPRMPAEKIIEAIHEGTARAMGGEFFRELARCLGELLGVRYAFVGKLLTEGEVSSVAVWGDGDSSRSFQYSLDGTPCENVVGQGTCFHPRHVQTAFPKDDLLAEIGAESYMGTPLRDAAGKTNGLLVVMDDRPMADVPLFRRVLEVFAARAGAELGRREAEAALRESEERYRAIAEDTPVLICRFLPGGEFTYVNKAYCTYFETSSEELVGSSFFPRIPEADRESVRANILALTIDAPTRSHEHRVIAPNGEIRWQRWTNRALFDDTGRVLAYQSIGEDVSERRQAEVALLRYQHIVASSRDMLALLDSNYVFLAVNEACCRVFEKTHDQLVGHAASEVLGDEYFETTVRPNAERCLAGEVVRFQAWMEFPANGRRHMDVVYSPYKGLADQASGFVVNGRDITEQKRAEKELHRIDQQLRTSVEQMPIAYILWNTEFRVVVWNASAERVFGYSEEEMVGKYAVDYIVPEAVRPQVRAVIRKLLSGEEASFSEEGNNIRKDGTTISCHWYNTPLKDRTGTAFAVLSMAIDVTDRKRAEEQRLSLERQVQHAQKLESLGVLAGGIAHDFNNILVAILGNADLALDELSPMSPVRQNIEEIGKAARRAAELAEQMLAYSGKGRFVVEPIDLGDLFEEMTQLLEVTMSKKVVLRYEFAEKLPRFNGDATQIRQIIMNLITNASEAIGDESGVIVVSTGAMDCDRAYLDDVHETLSAGLDELLPEGLYIYLEVSDTGCGMDAETTGKLFDPFFTTKFAGRGLGMAAVLGIVRGHHGTVKIHSELDKGTTFRILFRASELPEYGAAIQKRASGKAKAGHSRGTILIVDDEETVRAVGKKMLSRLGFKVLTAVDGRDAIDLFRKRSDTIDCVLLDLTMPRLDGEEAFRELRLIRPDVTVILCSGYNERDASQRFAGEALAGFLHKPYDTATLRETLMEVLPDDLAPLSGGNVGTWHEDLSPLISKFLEAIASDHASARSALDEGDYMQVSSLGHRIRGSAGFYAFTDLSRLGAELDLAATTKNRATVEALLDAVRAELDRLIASR